MERPWKVDGAQDWDGNHLGGTDSSLHCDSMSRTVLVVEDDKAIADNVVYALESEGLSTQWCGTAGDARRLLASSAFDLMVLDVGLPDEDGFSLCRDLRNTLNIPIIFLTARNEVIDRVVGLELGADDYIPKPFSPREVSARVKAVLRRFPQQDNEPRQNEPTTPFTIDAHRRAISFQGTALELSRYEYNILEILIEKPGWVFSRKQLMEKAWDDPDMTLDRTVDSHIKALRTKLRAVSPDIEVIETHRGVGYALRETW